MNAANDLDHILGSVLKVRVLRVLVSLEMPVSGRQAARLAGVSSKAIGALDDLAASGLVDRAEATGQNLYGLNRSHYLAGLLSSLFRAEEGKVFAIRDILTQVLASRADVVSAAIYGSVARGTAHPHSDLDVLVILESMQGARAVLDLMLERAGDLRSAYGASLSPMVLTRKQWQDRLRDRDAFARSVASDGLRILGRPLRELAGDEPKGKEKGR